MNEPERSNAHQIFQQIYDEGVVVDQSGAGRSIGRVSVDKREVQFLAEFIGSRPEVSRTLEVGCAYGLSSLAISSSTAGRGGAFHTIIDPFQQSEFDNIGIGLLESAGIDSFELIEEPSEFALPRLTQQLGACFDLVFIDGFHTFDHTLVDLFYANRLIGVGGYIVVDDCDFKSVSKAVSYFANYPCYEVVGGSKPRRKREWYNRVAKFLRPIAGFVVPRNFYDRYYTRGLYPSMVALKKVGEDQRDLSWFAPF